MPMQVDSTTYQSPNHSSRHGKPVGLFVLHATVGDAVSSLNYLCNPAPLNPITKKPDPSRAVSTHYLITKTGKIYRLVAEAEAAWHAGASRWREWGSADIRDGSIGVELENRNNGKDPYSPVQVDALTWLARDILTRHPLTPERFVTHAGIAIPNGRKTDPKGFPFDEWVKTVFSTPPVSPPATYKAIGLPIYQQEALSGPLAGHIPTGAIVTIDKTYPNGGGHLQDGRGFVDLDGLMEVTQ